MQLHICTEYVENAMQETPSTTSNVQGLLFFGFNLGKTHLTSYSNCTSESTTYSTGFIRIFFSFRVESWRSDLQAVTRDRHSNWAQPLVRFLF